MTKIIAEITKIENNRGNQYHVKSSFFEKINKIYNL